MSAAVHLSALVGAHVLDGDAHRIGRVIGATAEVEFESGVAQYFVKSFVVVRFGFLDAVAGWRIVQLLLCRLGRLAGVREFEMDPSQLEIIAPGRLRVKG
jgi:hypothetical protein